MSDNKRLTLQILAGAGVVLLAIGIVLMIIQGAMDRQIARDLAVAGEQLGHIQERLSQAQAVHVSEHTKYAAHWSEGLDDRLDAAEQALASAEEELNSAKTEFDQRHRKVARQHIDAANTNLVEAGVVVDEVLGTEDGTQQGLYDLLKFKQENAHKRMIEADIEIGRVNTLLAVRLTDPWNKEKGLSFSPAFALMAQAEEAREKADDAIQADQPLAYDYASEAITKAKDAETNALTDEANAIAAWNAIQAARAVIGSSRLFIMASSYQQSQALASLLTAEGTLLEAETAFENENFVRAKELADLALVQANTAQTTAVEPTATPIPWSSDDSNDDDSEWGFDPGSGDSDWSSDDDNSWGGDSGWSDDDSWGDSDWGSDDDSWGDSEWGSDDDSWGDSDWGSDNDSWDSDW